MRQLDNSPKCLSKYRKKLKYIFNILKSMYGLFVISLYETK